MRRIHGRCVLVDTTFAIEALCFEHLVFVLHPSKRSLFLRPRFYRFYAISSFFFSICLISTYLYFVLVRAVAIHQTTWPSFFFVFAPLTFCVVRTIFFAFVPKVTVSLTRFLSAVIGPFISLSLIGKNIFEINFPIPVGGRTEPHHEPANGSLLPRSTSFARNGNRHEMNATSRWQRRYTHSHDLYVSVRLPFNRIVALCAAFFYCLACCGMLEQRVRAWFGMYLDNGIVISARNGTTSKCPCALDFHFGGSARRNKIAMRSWLLASAIIALISGMSVNGAVANISAISLKSESVPCPNISIACARRYTCWLRTIHGKPQS